MSDVADDSLRTMVRLLKQVFDEAVLAGFSQSEAMALTSQTLQALLMQAGNGASGSGGD